MWGFTNDEMEGPLSSQLLNDGFEHGGFGIHHGRALLPLLELAEVESEELVPIPTLEEHPGLPVGDPLHDPAVHVERALGVLDDDDHPRQEERQHGRVRLRPRQHRGQVLAGGPLLGGRGVPLYELLEALLAAGKATGEAGELLLEGVIAGAQCRNRSGRRRRRREGRRRGFCGGSLELLFYALLSAAEAAASQELGEVEFGGGSEGGRGGAERGVGRGRNGGGSADEGGVARSEEEETRILGSVDRNQRRHGWIRWKTEAIVPSEEGSRWRDNTTARRVARGLDTTNHQSRDMHMNDESGADNDHNSDMPLL